MSAPKHSVKVSILNEEFTLRSDSTPDQAREIANYLDAAARQVMSGSNVIESNRPGGVDPGGGRPGRPPDHR